MIAEEPPLRKLLENAHTVRPVGEIVGYAANVSRLHGAGFALLGNAAEFLDPVFSSGVTIALKSAKLAADLLDKQFRGEAADWQTGFAEPLMYGVETFRSFVNGWYNGDLQDVIFFEQKDPVIRRMICSVLAGYAWDAKNPTRARNRRAGCARWPAPSGRFDEKARAAGGSSPPRCWRSARAPALRGTPATRRVRWCRPLRSAAIAS